MVFQDILYVKQKYEMIVHSTLYYYVITHNGHYAGYGNTKQRRWTFQTIYIYFFHFNLTKWNTDTRVQLTGSMLS